MRKILLIEDDVIIARDIKQILEKNNYEVCGILNGKEDTVQMILKIDPDIIISDIYLKNSVTGIEINKQAQKSKYFPLIFLTAYSTEDIITSLVEVKNDGYIVKPFTEVQLIATIKLVEKKYFSAKSKNPLTDRENEIAHYIMNGLENKEIALILNISEHTIRTHRKSIYSKLDVKNVAQLLERLSRL
ncbi:MAG TPA: response regulator transcription factor [Bacteroidales bacterium]|nr:response regulator transcription factor [Bacteroidales bacterium]